MPKKYKTIKFLFTPKNPYGNIKIDNKFYYIKINAKLPVFIATTIIKQNSPILENINVIKKEINFKRFYSKPLDKIKKDLIASKIISKNSIITTLNTKKAPLVLRGENVNVTIKSKNITITTTAKALKDGNIGDIINIEINRKIYKAIVINKNQVELK